MSGSLWVPKCSLAGDGRAIQPDSYSQGQPERSSRRKAKHLQRSASENCRTANLGPATGVLGMAAREDDSHSYSTAEDADCNKTFPTSESACGLSDNREFCGWHSETDEREIFTSLLGHSEERVSLNTQASSQSKCGFHARPGKQRKGSYKFKHLPDSQEYIKEYRNHHSYTALSLPHKIGSSCAEEDGKTEERCAAQDMEGEESTQCRNCGSLRESRAPKGRYRLQHLASWQEVMKLIKEKNMYKRQQTSPSNARRKKESFDILVASQDDKWVDSLALFAVKILLHNFFCNYMYHKSFTSFIPQESGLQGQPTLAEFAHLAWYEKDDQREAPEAT